MYDSKYGITLPQPIKWIAVVGFEDSHEVSNYGTVRSIERSRTWWRSDIGKEVTRTFPSKVLQNKKTEDGYYDVHIRSGDKNKHRRLHTVVAEAFLGKPDKDSVIDHKDDIKTNNFLWNLQYVSVQFNTKKAADSGVLKTGNQQYSKGLPEPVKECVRKLLSENNSIRGIARLTGVSQRSIARIRDGLI